MAGRPLTRRRRATLAAGGVALVLLVLALAFAGYTSYRVNRFSTSAFRPEETPPETQFAPPTVTVANEIAMPSATAPTTASATAEAATPPATTPAMPTTARNAPPPDTPTPATPTPAAVAMAAFTPTATPLPYGNSPVIARLRSGQRVTVLLLGFGGPGHDGAYLTDSLQVLSFDPRTGIATLISVPRDLWVYIPPFEGRGGYWGKVNEAYLTGMGQVDRDDFNVPYQKHDNGGRLAARTVAQVLGVPIDYWVSLDFVGFRQFIDALGGVEVEVERAFTDTQYPANDDANIDPSYRMIHFDAGRQRMDGQRAIEFARSRYSPEDGTDFGRARRQHRLMTAVKEQVFRVETIPKAFGLLGALEGHFHTSFSFAEARDLAGWAQEQARDKRPIAIRTGVLDTNNLLFASTSAAGGYILLPRTGQGEYAAIQRYVGDILAGLTPGAGGTPTRGIPSRTPATAPSPTAPGFPGSPSRTPTSAEPGFPNRPAPTPSATRPGYPNLALPTPAATRPNFPSVAAATATPVPTRATGP